MKKRSIMFMITGLGTGGAERFLLRTLQVLKREKNYDFSVVSLTNLNDIGTEIERLKIPVYYLGIKNIFSLFPAIFKFRKIVKKQKPQVLFTLLLHADLFGRIFGRLFGIRKIVCSIRNDIRRFPILRKADLLTAWLVDYYLPNSEATKEIIKKTNRIPEKKLITIPNFISILEIKKQAEKKIQIALDNKKDLIICTVGRLIPEKNLFIGIEAIKKIKKKNIHWIIIGEGPLKEKLKKEIKKQGLSKQIHLLGKKVNPLPYIKKSHIFLLPSITEGMSNALLEAMGLKKAIIASNIPQNIVLIKNNENGLTFNPHDSEALKEKILLYYNDKFKNNGKLMKEHGKKVFHTIKKEYTKGIIIKKIKALFDKIENVRDSRI